MGFVGELYPITVRNLPLDIHINTARFGASMDEALKYLDINTGIKVIETWLNRIDYQIKNGKTLDGFELAVSDNLMQLTNDNFLIRKEIFTYLITYDDTSFILSNLHWIINYWDKLHLSEQKQIINLINSKRTDERWIKAKLLNSYILPDEIVYHILGEYNLFDNETEYILSKFPEQLIHDCLNIYFGFSQPFWWLGFQYTNREFWDKIVSCILMNEKHTCFEICTHEFIHEGVNGSERFHNGDGLEIWETICNQTINKKSLTESLIYNTSICSCSIELANNLWSILIDSYSNINKENEIISLIVDNIELLQQTGRKEDLFEIFDFEFIKNKILPEITPDIILINTLEILNNNPFTVKEEKINIISKIIENTKEYTIRFFATFNYFSILDKESDIPKEIIQDLNKLPDQIDEIGKRKEEEIRKKYEYKLDNWIGVN